MNEIDDIDDAFGYLESFTNLERQHKPRAYRLERMQFLLDEFGHPEEGLRCIHVAGSKGKGSTSMFIASILDRADIPTGLYTSPHVVSYRERITRAGREFEDTLYVELIRQIETGVSRIERRYADPERMPTTFELLTLLAFMAFRRTGCTWAVIETGIGGRLDATNIISSEASVITPIELEHTDLLGNTIPLIASEKAGIIKPGKPVFVGRQMPEAMEVLQRRAEELGSPIIDQTRAVDSMEEETTRSGTDISIRLASGAGYRSRLRLIGTMQAENASLASVVVHFLFPDFEPKIIEEGLSRAFLPGRMEILDSDPPVLLDGAHTEASVARLLATYRRLYPGIDGVLIFGSVDGKNHEAMARILGPAFSTIIVTTPGFFKRSHPADVHRRMQAYNPEAVLVEAPARAVDEAVRTASAQIPHAPIVVTGSFYLVAEVRALLIDPAKKRVVGEAAT